MHLKNYNKKNHFNLECGTIMKGVIYLTPDEWEKASQHLKKEYQKAVKNIETYKRDSLGYAIKQTAIKNKPFSVGVVGTFEIVKKYNLLDKYKAQNYALIIN